MRLHVLTSAICLFLNQRLAIPRIRPVPSLWPAACKAVNSQSITSGLHWHAVSMRPILSLAPGEFDSDRMLVFMNAKWWDGSWLLVLVTDVTDNPASFSCNSVPKTGQPTLDCPGKSTMFNFSSLNINGVLTLQSMEVPPVSTEVPSHQGGGGPSPSLTSMAAV